MPAGDSIDLGRAFRFVPEDPDWIKKVLIGGVFMLLTGLVIGALFVAGYGVRLMRRTVAGDPRPMPEWDDLGDMAGDGLRALALYLAYALPATVIPAAVMVAVVLASSGLSRSAPEGATDALGAVAAMGVMGLYAVMAVIMLALSLYLPAAFARFVMLQRLGAGFEVAENVAFIKRNLGNYAMALLLYLLASFAAQLGILLCCVGFFPASFWAFCILCWALGEVVRRDPVLAPAPLVPRA
jgi:uncharacterized protein DUF4013